MAKDKLTLNEKVEKYRGVKNDIFHVVRACATRFDRADERLAKVENLPAPDGDSMHPRKAQALREFNTAKRTGELQWRHLWGIVKLQDDLIHELLAEREKKGRK